jgi:hypothetical protein
MALSKIQNRLFLSKAFERFDSLKGDNLTQISRILELTFNLNDSLKDKRNQSSESLSPLTQADVLSTCVAALVKFQNDPRVNELIMILLKNRSYPIDPQNITLLLPIPIQILRRNELFLKSSDPHQLYKKFNQISLLGLSTLIGKDKLTEAIITDFSLSDLQLKLPLGVPPDDSSPFDFIPEIKRSPDSDARDISPPIFIQGKEETPVTNELFTPAVKKLKTEKPAEPIKKAMEKIEEPAAEKKRDKSECQISAITSPHIKTKKGKYYGHFFVRPLRSVEPIRGSSVQEKFRISRPSRPPMPLHFY